MKLINIDYEKCMTKSRHSNINQKQESECADRLMVKAVPIKYKTKIRECENHGYKIEH